MPSYPSNLARRRAASPRTFAPKPVVRPGTQGLPTPANDNPKNPIRKPANDNPPKPREFRSPWRKPPPLPGRPFKGAPGFGHPAKWLRPNPYRIVWEGFQWGYRRFYPPNYDQMSIPAGGWRIKHGPNLYEAPWLGNPSEWGIGFVSTGDGPQTGLLSSQALNPRYASFAAYVNAEPSRTHAGWWIWNGSTTSRRYAVAFTLVRPGNPAFSTNLPPATRLTPAARPQWDPFLVPPINPYSPPAYVGAPLPGTHTPLWPYRPNEIIGQPALAPAPARAPSAPPAPSSGRMPILNLGSGRKGFHDPRPPARREKERKGAATRAMWEALNKFGQATEAMDFIDAAWKTLPASAKSKSYHDGKRIRPAWWKRARDVYVHYDKIDLEQFSKNVIANAIEDFLIGIQDINLTGRVGANVGKTHQRREGAIWDAPLPIDPDETVEYWWEAVEEVVRKYRKERK